MALSPADFYAFSQATGSPYVEDPEDRARIAPQVLEWRRNQLKQPQQEGNIIDTLGKVALGAGVLTAGALGARALARRYATQPVTVSVAQEAEEAVRRAAQPIPQLRGATQEISQPRPTPRPPTPDVTPSAPPPQPKGPAPAAPAAATPEPTQALTQFLETKAYVPAVESNADAADRLIAEYQQLAERQARTDQRVQASVREYQMQLQGKADRILNELRQESLVETHQAKTPFNVDQAINALDSGEDQMTGRVKRQLQRNEDLDLSQIEVMEDIAEADRQWLMQQDEPDAAINYAASQTSDGIPADQSEGTPAQRFLARERSEIASQLGEQGLSVTPGRIEQELGRRFGPAASEYGPKQTARRQALELYAQTGDPKLLEVVNPATIKTESMGEVPTSTFKKPVITEDTAQRAQEFLETRTGQAKDWLGELRVELEPKRNQILQERRNLAEQTAAQIKPQLETARSRGQVGLVRKLEGQLDNLRNLWRNPELGTHREDEYRQLTGRIEGARRKIEEDISGLQKQYPTTLKDWSGEGTRVFFEQDPVTGEAIAGTEQIRSGYRPQVESEKRRGSQQQIGSNIVYQGSQIDYEFDPLTAQQVYNPQMPGVEWEAVDEPSSTIGIYGIERRSMAPGFESEEATQRPTYSAPTRRPQTQPLTPQRLESVKLSEQVRRIQREGGDVQAFLNQFRQGVR